MKTLKSQITLALLMLVGLFVASTLYALHTQESLSEDDAVLRLGGQLELITQQIGVRALHYKDNAPRDYQTYFRDVRLYHRDVQGNIERFGEILGAFSGGTVPAVMAGMGYDMNLVLTPGTVAAAAQLGKYWHGYLDGLKEKLGPKKDEPRLEWAAEYIIANTNALSKATGDFVQKLRGDIQERAQTSRWLNRAVLLLALIIAMITLFWFYRRVLLPLSETSKGIQRVAGGDFGYVLPVRAENEIGWLARSFNRLSARLDAMFRLTAQLQRGNDLDQVLCFVANEFPQLLPLDWVGALFQSGDRHLKLERAYAGGVATEHGILRFPIANTLLADTMERDEPLHISDAREVAVENPDFVFLSWLVKNGYRDVIMLGVSEQSPLPGVLVFASRQAHAYSAEHLELLSRMSVLITVSFARTLRLVERSRLANIGEFASGIAHEIRNPLATIGLAFDHLRGTELPEGSRRRVELARSESHRIGDLLEEMLLYARHLILSPTTFDSAELWQGMLDSHADALRDGKLRITFSKDESLRALYGDRDRLTQVVSNLLRNAMEAAPANSAIAVSLNNGDEDGTQQWRIKNDCDPLEDAQVQRLFEPFYTNKPNGTGLGLPIVRRMVEAHGGQIRVEADPSGSFEIVLLLPVGGPDA